MQHVEQFHTNHSLLKEGFYYFLLPLIYFLFVVLPFFRNNDLQPYQESNKKFTHLVSRNNEILFETKDSFRTRKMHFWNKYLPSINNNSTLGANEVKMDRTLVPSGSATQTANEMKQNRVTVSDKENSSSGLSCVHWLLVTTCWTMLFLFSLWYTHHDNIIWILRSISSSFDEELEIWSLSISTSLIQLKKTGMYHKFKFHFDENKIYLLLIYFWKYGGFFFSILIFHQKMSYNSS